MTTIKAIRIATWAAVAGLAIAVGVALYVRGGGTVPGLGVPEIGGPFTLTDQKGATVTEAALAGHPTALFFGYTYCPDVCPTTLYDMTGWLKDLGTDGDKLKVYFVTVDPERDTQEQMAAYLAAFDPRITGLTGTRPAVDQMLKAYRVYWRKTGDGDDYLMDHTAAVYLIDGKGGFRGTIDYQEKPDIAFAKLKKLVEGG